MPRERGPVVLFRSGYDTLSALEFHPFRAFSETCKPS